MLYNINANDKNGTLPSKSDIRYSEYSDYTSASFTNYLDRLILQSMSEITLRANVPYMSSLPTSIFRGLSELVGGYDDSSSYYGDFANLGNYNYDNYGYTQLRYLAKQYSDGLPDGITYNKNKTAVTVGTDFIGKTLDLADLATTVKNVNASKIKTGIKIIGNAQNNSILGGNGNDYLLGGAGADTLNAGKGNDTLTGGKGDDVFIYTAGNDIITDYATGDKISLGAAISKSSIKGSSVVFTIGKNTLTVNNGANKTLTLINAKGKTYTTVVSSAKTLTVTNKNASVVTAASDVGTVNAANRTSAVKIYGNKLDNVISGGSKNDILYGESGNDSIAGNAGNDKIYGGASNDTLIGGTGNDSLWGDAGADVFIYNSGGGADVIYGFDAKDTLTLDTFDFTATYKNKAVTLKFDEGSVILKDFGTNTTFHINDETYQIKSNKFVKK